MFKSRVIRYCFITALLAIILTVAYDETAKAAEVDNITSISSFYSNGQYNSYYYNQLDTYAKVIYDKLLYNAEEMKSGNYTINIFYETATVKEEEVGTFFQSAIDAFDRDHPEIFWLSLSKLQLSYSVLNTNGINYVKNVKIGLIQSSSEGIDSYLLDEYIEVGSLQAEINEYKLALNNILSSVKSSDKYTTVKNIHDLLVLNNDYNSSNNMSAKAYKSVSAILGNIDTDQAPVCEGYARAFKVICDKLNIPCVIASGNASLNGNTIGHMWNSVLVDGHWYFVDITWDDPVLDAGKSYDELSESRKYAFFLVGAKNIKKTHTLSGMFADKVNYNVYFKYPLMNRSDYGDRVQYYKINIKKSSGGSISTNANDIIEVEEGTQINVYVQSDTGMELLPDSLKYNEERIIDNSFIMPACDITITAKFMKSDAEGVNDNNSVNDSENKDETLAPTNQDVTPSTENASNSHTASSTLPEKTIESSNSSSVDISNSSLPKADKVKNNKSEWGTSNILSNYTGNMPDMKYQVNISNSSDLSDEDNIVKYHITDGVFAHNVYASIDERDIDNSIKELLEKKFGSDVLIDTTVFGLTIFDEAGSEIELVLDNNQEFIMYIPVSKDFVENEDKIRLYYLNNDQLIVVNSEVCTLNDDVFYKIYFEYSGTYVMIEEIGKIQVTEDSDSQLISTNSTNVPIERGVEQDNTLFYIATSLFTIGCITFIISIYRKKRKIALAESKDELSLEDKDDNLSDDMSIEIEKV